MKSLVALIALSSLMLPVSQTSAQQTPESGKDTASTKLPAQPTDLVAVVDGIPILYRDVSQSVETRLKAIIKQTGQTPPPEQLEQARRQMVRMALHREIQTKLMYRAFVRKATAGKTSEDVADMEKQLTSHARKMFYESQLPQLLKQHGYESAAEADADLRKQGTSLGTQERMFVESAVAQQYMQGETDRDPEIAIPDMKFYYKENAEKYKRKSRARWEQLTVLFSKFDSKQEAYAAIVKMGNEAYFGGNVQAVAKRLSQEPLAEDNAGLHDWTFKDSLASDVLDQKIFSLPLNKLSQIIEDANGYHIVRVLEREPAGMVSFAEAQDKIREVLKDRELAKQQKNLLTKLYETIPVWTIFPKDVPNARKLERVAANPQAQLR